MTKSKKDYSLVNLNNQIAITQIVEKISVPNGFAKLVPQQRRLLLAAVLCSIVPADSFVRKVEMEHLEQHLVSKFQFAKDPLNSALAFAHQKALDQSYF